MNKKKIIGYIIGGIGGYLFSHYFISPYLFGSNEEKAQQQIIKGLDEGLNILRAKLPLQVDEYSTLVAIDRRDLKVAYTYEINSALIMNSPSIDYSSQRHKENLCASLSQTLQYNIHYDFIYQDINKKFLQSIPINKELCSI